MYFVYDESVFVFGTFPLVLRRAPFISIPTQPIKIDKSVIFVPRRHMDLSSLWIISPFIKYKIQLRQRE